MAASTPVSTAALRDPLQMTHYEVLGIPPSLVQEQSDPSQLLRRAYRRALLRHHPDKSARSPTGPMSTTNNKTTLETAFPMTSSDPSTSAAAGGKTTPSIDQISQALRVLSSTRQRTKYDRTLSQTALLSPPGATSSQSSSFRTGVEVVDLDDLAWDAAAGQWTRSCRCGNEHGYIVTETDLEDAAEQGELFVGCLDCSLWLKVHFAVLDVEVEAEPGVEPRLDSQKHI